MLDRCRRADSFFRPRSPTASRPISLREIFSAADGSEGVSDLPNMGMADAPHEPALVLYLPDKPLRGLVADASLDASPQARRRPRRTSPRSSSTYRTSRCVGSSPTPLSTPRRRHAAARAARAARRHRTRRTRRAAPQAPHAPHAPHSATDAPKANRSRAPLGPDSVPPRRAPQERHALTELLHSMLVLEPEKRCSAASALRSLGPLYSRAVGNTI